MSVSNQNVVPAFDPTGYASISGVQLKQLIDGIRMFADKGLVIETRDTSLGVPDVPAADDHPEWQRCMWRRITPTSVVPYLWVQSSVNHSEGGNDIKKWYSLNQLAGLTSNITTNQIADGAVTDDKVAESGIAVRKIIGNITGNATLAAGVIMDTTAAGGDLEGTYPNPTVKVGAVDAATLADHSIADIKMEIGDLTHGLQLDKLKAVGVTGDMIRTGASPDFLWEKFTPNKIVSAPNPVSAVDVAKIAQVADPYTAGFELVFPRILQVKEAYITATATGTQAKLIDVNKPLWAADGDTNNIVAMSVTIIPKATDSRLIVEWVAQVSAEALHQITVACFRDPVGGGGTPAIAAAVNTVGDTNLLAINVGRFSVVSAAKTSTTFKFRIYTTAGTWYLNRTATDNLFGNIFNSHVRVTEVAA